MKVFENVAFGLDFRKIPKKEKEQRVYRVLKLVGLEGLDNRFPSQLSGGQQQRVALARALVIEPELLLLDEPLSNLDARLRIQMRTEIKNIQNRLGITTIYVTHDQEEALSISDDISVLNKGVVQQVGTPRNIYEDPNNSFVAGFIGLANFLEGRISRIDKAEESITVSTSQGVKIEVKISGEENWREGSDVLISVRPETIQVYKHGSAPRGFNEISGGVSLTSYLGNRVRYEIETGWGDILRVDAHNIRHQYIFRQGEKVSMVFDRMDVKLIRLD
jgi:ABC-type Fe3+/spermidine/putrescine transport system ATPase subunit